MFITALCPTYRHPELLANSLALWEMQDYPSENRMLLILDDDPTFDSVQTIFPAIWELEAHKERFPTISAKYNYMLERVPPKTDAVIVWEDDDIYLPGYVSAHAKALQEQWFSKPNIVMTDYIKGRIIREGAKGRFHSTIGARMELIRQVGGWPDTRRADFDQQLMSSLLKYSPQALPWPDDAKPQDVEFIYRWHSGAAHCQSTMRSPDDETWYERGEKAYKPVPFVGRLEPKLDEFTTRMLDKYRRKDWADVR